MHSASLASHRINFYLVTHFKYYFIAQINIMYFYMYYYVAGGDFQNN